MLNLLATEPLFSARLPESRHSTWSPPADDSYVRDTALDTVAVPLDFIGRNYFPFRVANHPRSLPDHSERTAAQIGVHNMGIPKLKYTQKGRPIQPARLCQLLNWLAGSYPNLPAIYITQNGMLAADGWVRDNDRIAYMSDYLGVLSASVADGASGRSYFA